MPNGSAYKKTSIDQNDLKRFNIDIWKRFSSPIYPTVVTTNAYHVIKDKKTANFYIQKNKVDSMQVSSGGGKGLIELGRMKDRKQIDTFVQVNEHRFDNIEKSPQSLSAIKRMSVVDFSG